MLPWWEQVNWLIIPRGSFRSGATRLDANVQSPKSMRWRMPSWESDVHSPREQPLGGGQATGAIGHERS